MNKKMVFGWAIPIILIGAYLDTLFIGSNSFSQYVFICIWEYVIFWTGFYYGEKLTKQDPERIK